jgi:CheY-like chemotaxis protein
MEGDAMRARVLIVGDDAMLTETRVGLLSDWQPASSTSMDASSVIRSLAPDLLIVCQTVRDEKARELIQTARALNPQVRLLAVCRYAQKRDVEAECFEVKLNDPGAFRVVVADLLRRPVLQAGVELGSVPSLLTFSVR